MIKIRNIRKTFGENTILRGIDLDVGKGQVVVILGPSGSGKTTFLRCLNALEMPEDGQIEFDNERPLKIDFSKKPTKHDILALRRKSGMVFQQYNLFPHKTALENVMEGPVAVQGKPAAQAREEALKLLEKVGLGDKVNLYPYQLSGGQQQRVGIARALAPKPQVILADEPTSALDPATTRSVLECLEDINKRFNVTIVIVTHEMSVIRRLCDRAALLDKGKVVEIVEVRGNQIHAQSEIGRELIRED